MSEKNNVNILTPKINRDVTFTFMDEFWILYLNFWLNVKYFKKFKILYQELLAYKSYQIVQI